ncbi:MAG: 5'/3'-nucleotidase SurE [Thermodesulforhabdaceae bacterium]|jgi:5'-nucleotidase
MRILITNDDGIYAKGIEVLYQILAPEHDVYVVAPETEQSAVGHAITFLDPLRVKEVKRNGVFFGYAVNGTPADCVKLAIRELMKPLPDLVISGINHGANVGENVIYSGTVSAATEAAMLGFPSIAVSIDAYPAKDYSGPIVFLPKIIKLIEGRSFPAGVSLNINFPHCPAEEIKGIRVVRQGHLKYAEAYDRRVDPRNRVYYWLCSQTAEYDTDEDTDSCSIRQKYIAITPIHYDLTHYPSLDLLREWFCESGTETYRSKQCIAGSR